MRRIENSSQYEQLDIVVCVDDIDALSMQIRHPRRHVTGRLTAVVDRRDLIDDERLQKLDKCHHAFVLVEIVEFELNWNRLEVRCAAGRVHRCQVAIRAATGQPAVAEVVCIFAL